MNKFIALAALGLCFTSVYAKGPKKDKAEEGFVFTTVKENPITSINCQGKPDHFHQEPEPLQHLLVFLFYRFPGIRTAPSGKR